MSRINLYNASGCADPTAQAALESVHERENEVRECIRAIHQLLADHRLRLTNRMEIRDRENGRVYK